MCVLWVLPVFLFCHREFNLFLGVYCGVGVGIEPTHGRKSEAEENCGTFLINHYCNHILSMFFYIETNIIIVIIINSYTIHTFFLDRKRMKRKEGKR